MNNFEKEDCVFMGPVFGERWIPVSEVKPIEIKKDSQGRHRMSFYYRGKKWESGIAKK